MVRFPHAKINLGLHITGRRTDGYHNLQTIFHPIALNDILEIVPSSADSEPLFRQTGRPLDGPPDQNLCLKAWRLIQRHAPTAPSCQIHLHKVIPYGAGLGGGSSDAAFTLLMLNDLLGLQLNQATLAAMALELGSDCPFFLHQGSCFASGRGEVLEPVTLDLSAYRICLVNPGIHVSTAEAFRMPRPELAEREDLRTILRSPVDTWNGRLINDFEIPVFSMHPEIGALKQSLLDQGAAYASLSGSGSTVFGLFRKTEHHSDPVFPSWYFQKWV